jgi:serine phosphatase RsbU (regulator of sigma subunit)
LVGNLITDMSLEVQVGVAKVNKWSVQESGDTFEMVERPHGGLSFVLVDGQSHGVGAKRISNLVARKAISLLGEGIRDGASARAVHDYLYTLRQGKVSATLNFISVDLVSRTVVVTRNSHCPVLIHANGELRAWDEPSEAIGIRFRTRPAICEVPLSSNLTVTAFTDGLLIAGERTGRKLDYVALIKEYSSELLPAQTIANQLLANAIERDGGRPSDDISILVVATRETVDGDLTRRMSVSFPVPF